MLHCIYLVQFYNNANKIDLEKADSYTFQTQLLIGRIIRYIELDETRENILR